RRPPRLSPQMLEMLQRFCPFFNRLSPGEKIVFEGRVALFRMGTDWTPLSWPDDAPLPPDVELALASQAVSLTFNKYTFLFKRFEKVIVYPKQFPTPEHPYLHSSELYEPDGCLIFSAENLMHGFFSAGKVYHVGLHEYAKAYLLEYPNESWPTWDAETVWETLEKISNLSREHIETTVGLAGLEPLPIMIHHFFIYRESFKTHAPEWFETLRFVFD
ncbi:MAG: zinc-dependent peptidase, partial [Saprospiraceae bacterium]|nr:zinc-dependent peptidase [Saprospiraceae bacterium]